MAEENGAEAPATQVATSEEVAVGSKATPAGDPVIASLYTKVAEYEQLIDKLRGHEKTSLKKAEAAEREANDWKTRYRTREVDAQLTEVIKAANAKSVTAVMKLIDRNLIKEVDGTLDPKSLQAAVDAVKSSEAFLFEEASSPAEKKIEKAQAPGIKRASEGDAQDSKTRELQACKSEAEIIAVLNKYGIKH